MRHHARPHASFLECPDIRMSGLFGEPQTSVSVVAGARRKLQRKRPSIANSNSSFFQLSSGLLYLFRPSSIPSPRPDHPPITAICQIRIFNILNFQIP
jgi:hypothetical protein